MAVCPMGNNDPDCGSHDMFWVIPAISSGRSYASMRPGGIIEGTAVLASSIIATGLTMVTICVSVASFPTASIIAHVTVVLSSGKASGASFVMFPSLLAVAGPRSTIVHNSVDSR